MVFTHLLESSAFRKCDLCLKLLLRSQLRRLALSQMSGDRSSDLSHLLQEAFILSTARTPIGAFQGSLSSLSATELGAIASTEAIKRAGIKVDQINEVILGNVVSSGLGQAPATQVSIRTGLPQSIPSTTVNKVCSSGMKTVMLAAQSIRLGENDCVLAGGFESMSNIPFYLPKARQGYGLGNGELQDGLLRDGLMDSIDNHHMGVCAEVCAANHQFTREQQDEFALESYRRAQEATKAGQLKSEIIPVTIKSKKGEIVVAEDEDVWKLQKDKVPLLKSPFKKDGTVTAANASKLNDGACSIIVGSSKFATANGIKPLARIVAYADAQMKPIDFPIAPSAAIPLALKRAGLTINDIDAIEINEAFSAVALANAKLLNIDLAKLNVFGGAVALGHPIGSSGARIIGTLINVLKARNGKYGVASICNGGGGASAIVIERL